MSYAFVPFNKLSRLSSACTITEKIDGTNAQIFITEFVDGDEHDPTVVAINQTAEGNLAIRAGSRTRWIIPGKETDNFGFAHWVLENTIELTKLGIGQHFGEWYGGKIQRGYGRKDHALALFDVRRWGAHNPNTPTCCTVVPTLYQGAFSDTAIEDAMMLLKERGSVLEPGFMNAEGIVIYLQSARTSFKKTFEYDKGKWTAAA